MNRTERAWLNSAHRTVKRIAAVVLIALALAACGKKGTPQPPADEPNTYPRTYPHA